MRQFALKSEWQRRDDRNRIGANSPRLAPLLNEPATQHTAGYTKFAQDTFTREKALVEKLGLAKPA